MNMSCAARRSRPQTRVIDARTRPRAELLDRAPGARVDDARRESGSARPAVKSSTSIRSPARGEDVERQVRPVEARAHLDRVAQALARDDVVATRGVAVAVSAIVGGSPSA